MVNKTYIPMKVIPEFRQWIIERQKNIQKFLEVEKITLVDTQRIIAKTNGVDINKEILKRVRLRK